jgi:hypothetical protein
MRLTKPQFYLRDGKLSLRENPIQEIAQLDRLSDPTYIAEIGKHDYWYMRDQFPRNEMPYARVFLHGSFWRDMFHGKGNDMDAHHINLWSDPVASEILRLIVREFLDETKKNKQYGIVMFIPRIGDVRDLAEGRRVLYEEFLRQEASKAPGHFLDLSPDFYQKIKGQDFAHYYQGHPTAEGHQVFAELIEQFLRNEGLLKL